MEVWVCGKHRSGKVHHVIWDLQGVFSTEALAIAACKDDTYFIGPAGVDKVLLDATEDWPGCYYPTDISPDRKPEPEVTDESQK